MQSIVCTFLLEEYSYC